MFNRPNSPPLLEGSEKWARRAVSIPPDNSNYNRTLAFILAALDKGKEALEMTGKYVADSELVQTAIEDAIRLFIELAASGYAREVLELIENSPAAAHLEPLVVGLKLYTGEDVKTTAETHEVAKDVVKRIEDRKKERETQPRGPEPGRGSADIVERPGKQNPFTKGRIEESIK